MFCPLDTWRFPGLKSSRWRPFFHRVKIDCIEENLDSEIPTFKNNLFILIQKEMVNCLVGKVLKLTREKWPSPLNSSMWPPLPMKGKLLTPTTKTWMSRSRAERLPWRRRRLIRSRHGAAKKAPLHKLVYYWEIQNLLAGRIKRIWVPERDTPLSRYLGLVRRCLCVLHLFGRWILLRRTVYLWLVGSERSKAQLDHRE